MSEIFEDADKTLAYIKERSDDFDRAVIFGLVCSSIGRTAASPTRKWTSTECTSISSVVAWS